VLKALIWMLVKGTCMTAKRFPDEEQARSLIRLSSGLFSSLV